GGRRFRRRARDDGATEKGLRAHLRQSVTQGDQPYLVAVFALRLVLPGQEGRGRRVHVRGLRALAARLQTRPLSAARRAGALALGVDARGRDDRRDLSLLRLRPDARRRLQTAAGVLQVEVARPALGGLGARGQVAARRRCSAFPGWIDSAKMRLAVKWL